MKTAVLLLLIPLLLPGQEEPKKAAISGKVVDAISNQPLRKASLSLSRIMTAGPVMGPPAAQRTETGAEGNFQIDNVEPGTYMLAVERQGYVRASYSVDGRPERMIPLKLDPGQHLTDLTLKMTPQALVTGRTLDADGEPLAGFMVSLQRWVNTATGKRLIGGGMATTNDLGEFRLAGVPPGAYLLQAMPRPNYTPSADAAPLKPLAERLPEYVPTFYPGVEEATSAQNIALAAGQTVANLDITLRKRPLLAIRGKVIPAMRDLRIMAMSGEEPTFSLAPRMPIALGKEGEFVIPGLVPGQYAIVLLEGLNQMRAIRRVMVTLGKEDIEDVVIPYVPPVAVKGKIIVEGDLDVYAQKYGAALDLTTLRVQPSVVNGITFGISSSALNEKGEFTLDHLGAEEYLLRVIPQPPGTYLKAITVGGQELAGGKLDLRDAAAPGELVVHLSTAVGAISGTVVDEKGNPAGGVSVAVVRLPFDPIAQTRNRQLRTDQNGRFEGLNVGAGEYRVLAYTGEPGFTVLNAEVWPKVESKSERVQIEPGATASLSLKLTPVD
jgi:5-hydroxyisourate hydrolase-like protein (transthyretin family)